MSRDGGERETDDVDASAAAWVVRLSREPADEADWPAFIAWLDGAPVGDPERRRRAFDQAQRLWLDADRLRITAATSRRTRGRPVARPGVKRELIAAVAAAAVAVLALTAVWTLKVAQPATSSAPVSDVYATAPGERRSVVLADGSRVELDGATRLVAIRDSGAGRDVTLTAGEASFDVVHDPARPFRVDLGGSQVRVLGTAFDVVRSQDSTAVSVSRGLVSFSTGVGDVGLPAGRAAILERGVVKVRAVNPSDVDAWRKGRRLYWNQSLAAVISDLNRDSPKPLRLGDAASRRLRFTGVLVLGTREEMVRRLTALLPLRAEDSSDGTVVLRSRDPQA